MAGHGHVVPNPDGVVARCGGPAICRECALEKAQHDAKAKTFVYESGPWRVEFGRTDADTRLFYKGEPIDGVKSVTVKAWRDSIQVPPEPGDTHVRTKLGDKHVEFSITLAADGATRTERG